MITPFEYFRTPIQIRRFTQGFYLFGKWQEGSQVVLSADLITGNVVNITLNGVALAAIPFTTSSQNTLSLIQAALAAQPGILQVDLSGTNNRTITVVPLQPNLSNISVFTVTGGVSQPTVTISNSPTILNATASVQPIKGEEVMLVPEGRRDRETYTMFTSTQILGVTTQNPDQVTVLKGPYTGIVFECIEIQPWQNNANFNITNHYMYIAWRLAPLP
jgi:hypothetical protein